MPNFIGENNYKGKGICTYRYLREHLSVVVRYCRMVTSLLFSSKYLLVGVSILSYILWLSLSTSWLYLLARLGVLNELGIIFDLGDLWTVNLLEVYDDSCFISISRFSFFTTSYRYFFIEIVIGLCSCSCLLWRTLGTGV